MMPKAEVREVRAVSNGHSNGKPMKRIVLWIGSEEKVLASWVEAGAAEAFVAEAGEGWFER